MSPNPRVESAEAGSLHLLSTDTPLQVRVLGSVSAPRWIDRLANLSNLSDRKQQPTRSSTDVNLSNYQRCIDCTCSSIIIRQGVDS
jgi:hypothetical protein